MALLEIENLSVTFDTLRGPLKAVDQLSFQIEAGDSLGIVGESGSGKSVSSLAIMNLLGNTSHVSADRMMFESRDISKKRGEGIAMIFQDPMTSLNPCFSVGFQLKEAIKIHEGLNRSRRHERAVDLLRDVGIPSPETRLSAFPHQLSGGMCQRVMIAMAVACKPKLLIADEPTTALDVTIQAQILRLIKDLQKKEGMALILITHDIAVVAEYADRLMVMYAGQAVESGETGKVIGNPSHPYTSALLQSLPGAHSEREHRTHLPSIPGVVPDLVHRPKGCQLHPRCEYVQNRCKAEIPPYNENEAVRCFYPLESEDLRG